jgi:hypothetical protein
MPNQNNITSCVARTKILVALPIILQSFSFITQKWILEKYLLQNPKSQRMEDGQERERESGKSSSITIAQDMVSWE